jgi:hypothetical protein
MKKIIFVFLLLALSSCGYSTVYKNNETHNITLIIGEMRGDKDMNSLIKNQLKIYSLKSSKDKFYIDFDSKFLKTIISKNASGAVSDYELYLETQFEIKYNDKEDTFNFKRKFNVKNISDSFGQKNYEYDIRKNYASSIKQQLFLKLLNMR